MKALILGDVCPTKESIPYFKDKNIPELFGDSSAIFDGRDLITVNLECALTEHGGAINKFGPNLKAPKETAEVLASLGVSLCSLSNNHIFDYGIKGALDTLAALDEVGIAYTGFGKNYDDSRKNYTFEKNGERICIITVCEHEYSYALPDRMGSRPFDEFDTPLDVRAAKADHDRVIVLYHGGKEMCQYPSPRLMKLCRTLAKSGADAVICQHSHCIGAYECYEGCHILYGQGNFHFIESGNSDLWNTELAVEYDTVSNEMSFIPLRCTKSGIRLAFGEDKDTIMSDFKYRCGTLATGEWRDGWHAFCQTKRESYVKAIREACLDDSTEKQNAKFAHYLDCEAHTDVWRELFPTYNLTNEKE